MYGIVRQGDTHACWAACVSMLTGIPFDALPQEGECQAGILRLTLADGEGAMFTKWFPATDTLIGYAPDADADMVPTIEDWQAGIGGAWFFDSWTHWLPGMGEGILLLAMYGKDSEDVDGHAVVINEDGYIIDPALGGLEGVHVMEILMSCNTEIVAFMKLVEVDHVE